MAKRGRDPSGGGDDEPPSNLARAPAASRLGTANAKLVFHSTLRGGDWLPGTVMGVITLIATATGVVMLNEHASFTVGGILGGFAVISVLCFLALTSQRRKQLTLRIGDDGVQLARRGVHKFFPIDSLESCAVVEVFELAEGLDLVRRDGRTERIEFPSLAGVDLGVQSEPARKAAEAIEAAIARFRALERSRHDRADLRLARHGETTLGWVTALRRAEERAPASYRDSASSSDDVLAVLDDPAAPPAMRVAAAIALEGTAVRRDRVRVAAEQTAVPGLAAALRLVLVDAPPEKLAEALDELEADIPAEPLRAKR